MVLAALCGLVLSGIWLSRFSRDESQWIYTARYLTLLTHGQFDSPEWDSYWTHTQPPLARYVMGASLKLGGFDLLNLNGPWDFSKEDSQNRAEGSWPSDGMLTWARVPAALSAVAAVVLLFLLGRALGGTPAGLFAAAWFALNPRLRELTTRAESEGFLVFLVLVALLLTVRLLAVRDSDMISRRGLALSILIGVVGGLAASTKLTGALSFICFWASLIVYVFVLWKEQGSAFVRRRFQNAAAQILASGLAAALIFVVLNPYTYPQPLERSLSLFKYRQDEMATQMRQYPTAALTDPGSRITAAFERPLFAYSLVATNLSTLDTRNGQDAGEKIPLDALLSALGLMVGGVGFIKTLKQRLAFQDPAAMSEQPADSTVPVRAIVVMLVWSVIAFVAIAASLGLDWDRYVILLSLFACVWAGLGAGWIYDTVAHRVVTRRSGSGSVEKALTTRLR